MNVARDVALRSTVRKVYQTVCQCTSTERNVMLFKFLIDN